MPEIETETTIEIDPIESIYDGECQSLSGRSTLTYAIGRHAEDGTLHLRITGNSGGGMFCKEWASASDVHEIVLGATEITAKCLAPLWAGKSVNTFSFGLAALRDIGLVEVDPDQSRQHRHVSGKTLEKCVSAHMAQPKAVATEKGGRKTLTIKCKEG